MLPDDPPGSEADSDSADSEGTQDPALVQLALHSRLLGRLPGRERN